MSGLPRQNCRIGYKNIMVLFTCLPGTYVVRASEGATEQHATPRVSLPVPLKPMVPSWGPHSNPNHFQVLLTLNVFSVQHPCS